MKYTQLLVACSILYLGILTAATPFVKIINTSEVPIAFVLVPTARGSNHKNLYIAPDTPLDVGASVKQNIKVFFLHPKEDVTIPNLRQNIMAYDRTLWVVPLPESGAQVSAALAPLGDSVYNGTLRLTGVKPFEVGSAKTAEISGTKNALKINTTGKLSQGAKALMGLAKNEAQASTQNQALVGHNLDDLLSGSVASAIQEQLATRSRSGGPASKKVAPKKGKSANGNPEGWPTSKSQDMNSFDQAVKALKLTPKEISQLKDYKNLGHDDRNELMNTIKNKALKEQTALKRAAHRLLSQYTQQFDS